jgi:hypothetical protein
MGELNNNPGRVVAILSQPANANTGSSVVSSTK